MEESKGNFGCVNLSSHESKNRGLEVSNKKGAFTVGILGNKGGKIKEITNLNIIVNSESTPRIQEGHRVIYHIICQIVEEKLNKKEHSDKYEF